MPLTGKDVWEAIVKAGLLVRATFIRCRYRLIVALFNF